MAGADEADPRLVEKDRCPLDDENLSYLAAVAGKRVAENKRVGPLGNQRGYVEGSEGDPGVIVERIVSCACEMVEPSGNIDYELVVDQNVQLSNAVVPVVTVERLECKVNLEQRAS